MTREIINKLESELQELQLFHTDINETMFYIVNRVKNNLNSIEAVRELGNISDCITRETLRLIQTKYQIETRGYDYYNNTSK